jgi:transposase InsO family protein
MKVHGNAALGPAGRLALVQAIESGMTLRAAAAALNVAPATAHRWWHRFKAASEEERRHGVWLADRSSRPRHQPQRLSASEEEPILRARRETGLGPGRLAGICRRPRSTIWKVLHRHGLSRRSRSRRESYRRYEWSRSGALLHVDVARLARFEHPGHRATGVRAERHRNRGAGYVYLHACVDDRSRYAYVEQLQDERATTAAAFMRRALAHFARLGLAPPEAVMSDNGSCYRARLFAAELAAVGARQILTPPYTPRWNGKVERFFQTLKREWAYAHYWPSSAHRSRALPSFLRYYNRRRPHSSLGTGRRSAAFTTSVGRTSSALA